MTIDAHRHGLAVTLIDDLHLARTYRTVESHVCAASHLHNATVLNNESLPDCVKDNLGGVMQIQLLHQVAAVCFNG